MMLSAQVRPAAIQLPQSMTGRCASTALAEGVEVAPGELVADCAEEAVGHPAAPRPRGHAVEVHCCRCRVSCQLHRVCVGGSTPEIATASDGESSCTDLRVWA